MAIYYTFTSYPPDDAHFHTLSYPLIHPLKVISRAHRMGATRTVHVELLVMRGTMEAEMLALLSSGTPSSRGEGSDGVEEREGEYKAWEGIATGEYGGPSVAFHPAVSSSAPRLLGPRPESVAEDQPERKRPLEDHPAGPPPDDEGTGDPMDTRVGGGADDGGTEEAAEDAAAERAVAGLAAAAAVFRCAIRVLHNCVYPPYYLHDVRPVTSILSSTNMMCGEPLPTLALPMRPEPL